MQYSSLLSFSRSLRSQTYYREYCASGIHNKAKAQLMSAGINLTSDTIKTALLTATHAFNADNNFWSDISANEVSGTGYTAGGATLASKTVTQDDTNDRAAFDAADVTWASSTITARYAAVYKDTGVTTTSALICCFDFATNQSSSNGDFTIQWHANGIFTLS